MTQVVHREL